MKCLVLGLFFVMGLFGQVYDLGNTNDPCTGGNITVVSGGVLDPTARFGNFSCKLPISTSIDGLVMVRFMFMENTINGAGNRLFQIKVNDQIMFDRLDIFVSCGGKLIPCSRDVVSKSMGGFVNVQFVTQVRSAICFAIEVVPLGILIAPLGITEQKDGYVVTLPNGELRKSPSPPMTVVIDMQACTGMIPPIDPSTLGSDCSGIVYFKLEKPDGGTGGMWLGVAAPPGLVLSPGHWFPVN